MLPPKLQEIVDQVGSNRKSTLDLVSGLSCEEFLLREEGEWSVSEILEHMVLAETGTSKLVRKMLKENAGKLPPYPSDDSVLAVRRLDVHVETLKKAPEAARPKGGMGKDKILALAAESRSQTLLSIAMMAGADPRSVEFPHPMFGTVNLYEWVSLIVLEHEKVHHPQIGAIVRRLRK